MDPTPELIYEMAVRGGFAFGNDYDDAVEFYLSNERALFPLTGVHVSRSLHKTIRSGRFEVRFDTNFEAVMVACRRPEPKGNWISSSLIRCYVEIARQGWGHCSECWREGRLVGGVYGIAIGGVFIAESMFHRETDASKVALWALVERCRELGFVLFDAQVMNPHLASLGAYPATHEEYMRLLAKAREVTTVWSR